jgi:hypothetical protein
MTIRTDSFTRANGAIGSSSEGWSWTDTVNEHTIVSNAAESHNLGSLAYARCNGDLGGADHYSLVQILNNTHPVGVLVRCADASSDCYIGFWNSGASQWELYRRQSGGVTLLDSDAGSGQPVVGDVIRGEANGTTISLYQNETLRCQATDSALSTQTKGGICGAANSRVDNFVAGLLSDPIPSTSPSSTASSSPSPTGGSTSPSGSPSSDRKSVV